MKDVSFFSKIYIAIDPVDFRKQAHGLALIVDLSLKLQTSAEKSMFVFTNKKKNAVKLLYWDFTGFALWWKVLERDRFRWPKSPDEVMKIHPRDLKWLLEGVDFSTLNTHKKIEYDSQFQAVDVYMNHGNNK